MGFSNGSANKELLEELNFDMGAVIELLHAWRRLAAGDCPSAPRCLRLRGGYAHRSIPPFHNPIAPRRL